MADWIAAAKHKIKPFADSPSQALQSFGQAGPGSQPTGKKCPVQIGTELLLHRTSKTVSGLCAMPAQWQYASWL